MRNSVAIDSDLLFTENFELISPKLHEVVDSKWGLALIGHPLAVTERTRERIVELTVQIVWAFLCDNRPRYLQDRDGEGRLEL